MSDAATQPAQQSPAPNSLELAGLTFAAAMACRNKFVPMELLMVAVFVLVLLACCALAYRFIEAPMQRQGRRLAQRLDARFGDDVVWRPRPQRAGELASRPGA